MHRYAFVSCSLGEYRRQVRVIRMRHRGVFHFGAIEERVGPRRGSVDELGDDHEVAGFHFSLEGADRARCQDGLHADRLHRPQVGSVVHPVRGELMVVSVARQEHDATTTDRSDV